jgi:hypothetical protein
MPTACDCPPFSGTPGANCGVSPCGPRQRLETRICSPIGCEQARGFPVERCVDDLACCDRFVDTPNCGRGVTTPPRADNCPFGDRITRTTCGNSTATVWGCRLDISPIEVDGNPDCLPHCLGEFKREPVGDPRVEANTPATYNPTLGVMCPGDEDVDPDTDFYPPPADPWDLDATGYGLDVVYTGCDNARKCQLYCPAPLIIHPTAADRCVAYWQRFYVAPTRHFGPEGACFGFPKTLWPPGAPAGLVTYCECHDNGGSKPKVTTIRCVITSTNRNLAAGTSDLCAPLAGPPPITVRTRSVTGVGCRNPGVPSSLCEVATW